MATENIPVEPKLLEYCNSERQREAVQALITCGSITKAAKQLGVARSSLANLIARAKRNAALHGWSPENDLVHPVDEAHVAKGTSTLYNEDGKPILQWVKTDLKHDRMVQIMREVADELKSDIKPAKPVKLANKTQLDELLNLYVLTDIHFGMRAWDQEAGANWDLEIAEKTVLDAFSHQIACSPDARTGFFLQLGDGLHYDGIEPETPSSRHVLDTDSRFPKIVRTAIRVFRQCTAMLLAKHEQVVILHAQGNHDKASSVWLQEWTSVLYENEPRVKNIVNPNLYYAYQHGKVLLGAHHGHKRSNPADLASVFIDQYRNLHGTTCRTYIHSGHLHSDRVWSRGNTKVERHETLAARDAYAAGGGYNSDRSLKCITYDHNAERGRSIFYPDGDGSDGSN